MYCHHHSPVGTSEQACGGRNGRDLVGVRLYAKSCVVPDAKEVVDDLETLRARGVVGAADIHECLELRLRVVAQELQRRQNGRGCDVERDLVLDYAVLLDELWQA